MTGAPYVRRLAEPDWHMLRAVRLAALADSLGLDDPAYRRESEFTATRWRRRLREHAQFAVFVGERAVGLVAAQPDGADTVYLYSLWLEPAARGLGLAALLIDAVVEWARRRGSHTVRLRVETANTVARNVYAGLGFTARPGDTTADTQMAMTLTVR